MKHRRLQLNCLLVVAVLLSVLTLPCRAMTQPTFSQVSSFEEFLARYQGEDEAERIYLAHSPLLCRSNVILNETPGAIELAATAGIRIAAGASLTLDNSKLLVMGPPPVITVEAGGTLRILDWGATMTDGSMPTDGMITVEAGGTLQLGDGMVLPASMVVDENAPPNTVSPPEVEPEPKPIPKPDTPSEPEPSTPPFSLTGEVVKVNSQGEMTVYLTMPRLPNTTEGFCVERSTNGIDWTQVLTFRVSATMEDAIPQWEAVENPLLVTRHSDDGAYTFLPYLAQSTDTAFFLRIVLEQQTGQKAVSQSVKIRLATTTPPGGDYDGSTGNQGGGGQGQFDRPGQQTPPTTLPDSPASNAPQPTAPQVDTTPQSAAEDAADMSETSDLSVSAGMSSASPLPAAVADSQTYLSSQAAQRNTGTPQRTKSDAAETETNLKVTESVCENQDEGDAVPAAVEEARTDAAPQTVAESKAKGTGDQSGYATLASLTLCGCAAAAGTLQAKKKPE